MRSSRWHARILIAALLVALLASLIITTARAADPPRAPVVMAEVTALRTCQSQLGLPRAKAPAFRGHHSDGYWRWQLNVWTLRHNRCTSVLHERARQWDWQAWLPDKWQRIGACETGYGVRPGNWHHRNSSYEGAFGFAVSSWDAFKLPGYPDSAADASPWQQYQVALRIYHRYGLSGWGCRNA